MEKYFRRLVKLLLRNHFKFTTHSVIYPGKRLYVNRQKRIKALKEAGHIIAPQKDLLEDSRG